MIGSECMQALHFVSNADYILVNGSIRMRDSLAHIRVYSMSIVTKYNDITQHYLTSTAYMFTWIFRKGQDHPPPPPVFWQTDIRRRDLAVRYRANHLLPRSNHLLLQTAPTCC
ncbi:uncharacterized protein LOC119338059 isoform X2 [Triticum dicoccoides]|uniref:uncharacterized protein LOC119338059 isoform X2 n=1 Tax=Triticum dicoccoides TaxID=85692 RepID=UPI0018905BB0|nr:uncharacterized protein LOC119338059 isoform X2 [Triticum dicoccoides]XP_044402687.1 uncharacterized protein LOC123127060 isoform X2 [Triticum aestivum]